MAAVLEETVVAAVKLADNKTKKHINGDVPDLPIGFDDSVGLVFSNLIV